MEAPRRRYVLLDGDGVVCRQVPKGSEKWREGIPFLPRALEALRALNAGGYAGIVIAQQPCGNGEARAGAEWEALTRRLLLEVALAGGYIAKAYHCRHEEKDKCHCFKPTVGLIARARADFGFCNDETYFVGEREFGLRAAAAAGHRCIRIQRSAFLQAESDRENGQVASSLFDAVDVILAARRDTEQPGAMGTSRRSERGAYSLQRLVATR